MISYIGGKARIGKWIVPYIPNDIETYVEGFSGMFWVFFNMDLSKYPNLKTIVYNDYNRLNANLFRCSKHYDRLWEELSKYPCQQLGVEDTPSLYSEMFDRYQKEIFSSELVLGEEPDFEIAAKYVYVLTQVFSGSKPESSKYTDYKGKYRCKVLIFMDKLKHPKYREHLDKITFIENKDFEDIVKKYDSPTTYFYMDPPYWKTENYYSNHIFNREDHARLASSLYNISGKFSLSYYEFDNLHLWFPSDDAPQKKRGYYYREGDSLLFKPVSYRWERQTFKKAAAAKKDGSQNDGIELLIMNY